MAKVAGRGDMCACQREAGRAVVERRAEPGSSGVAGRARCRISGADMVRHGAAKRSGALIIRCMAAVAIRRKRAAIVAVHVAQGASDGSMGAGQRECCCAVIECRRRPVRRRMAD